MSTLPAAPAGFVRVAAAAGDHALYCGDEQREALTRAGLDRPGGWQDRLAAGESASGRGALARVSLADGSPVVLKQLRRGGAVARLLDDRFAGTARLFSNFTLPHEAAARGIATPPTVALMIQRAGSGHYRGWLALEELERVRDLAALLRTDLENGLPAVEAAMGVVRSMHDHGLRHPDLNLGNLAVRPEQAGWQAFVLDLDRATLYPERLCFALRVSSVRRLERSYVKSFGADGPLGPDGSGTFYRLYAADDAELTSRLERARRRGRPSLAWHRMFWPTR